MILYVNHTRRDTTAITPNEIVDTALSLLEEGQIEPGQFARMRIDLDWVQYKQNFREAVIVTRGAQEIFGQSSPFELRIDSRQVAGGSLRDALLGALRRLNSETECQAGRFYLEEFQTFRTSIAWDFNRLYWHRLKDWSRHRERVTTRRFPGAKRRLTIRGRLPIPSPIFGLCFAIWKRTISFLPNYSF